MANENPFLQKETDTANPFLRTTAAEERNPFLPTQSTVSPTVSFGNKPFATITPKPTAAEPDSDLKKFFTEVGKEVTKKTFQTFEMLDRPNRALWAMNEKAGGLRVLDQYKQLDKYMALRKKHPKEFEEYSRLPLLEQLKTPFARYLGDETYPETKEIMKAGLDALKGKDKRPTQDIIEGQLSDVTGGKLGGIPLFATSLGVNIYTDPLRVGGAYKLLGKGIALGGKVAKRIPGVQATGKFVGRQLEPVTEVLRGLFSSSKVKSLADAIDNVLASRFGQKVRNLQFSRKFRDSIQKVAERSGQAPEVVNENIGWLLGVGDWTEDVLTEAAKRGMNQNQMLLARTARSHLTSMLSQEIRAGVPVQSHLQAVSKEIEVLEKSLAGAGRNANPLVVQSQLNALQNLRQYRKMVGYFPRIPTSDAQKMIQAAGKKLGKGKQWETRMRAGLHSITREQGISIDDFNAYVKANGIPSLGGKSVDEYFSKSVPYVLAKRGEQSIKAVTSADYYNQVIKQFGRTVEQIPKEDMVTWRAVSPDLQKAFPRFKGVLFPGEIVKDIETSVVRHFRPEEINAAWKMFDKYQNLWKAWTLAPFPKYHLRNMASNFWNNYLADVSFGSYEQGSYLQMYRKYKYVNTPRGKQLSEYAMSKLNATGISPAMADEIIRTGETSGVFGGGWYGSDITDALERATVDPRLWSDMPVLEKLGKFTHLMSKEHPFIQKGFAAGRTIENNARVAHYIDKLGKGGAFKNFSPALGLGDDLVLKSSRSVNKYLFDYSALSPFEQQTMKRLMPFYTWTRKNIPLQLETLATKPQKFLQAYRPLFANRDPQDLLRLKYTNPKVYNRFPIEVRRDLETVTYLPLEGLLPTGDLSKVANPKALGDMVVELLTPGLRLPAELVLNLNFSYGRELGYEGEWQRFMNIPMPYELKHALTVATPQARVLNEIDNLIKKKRDDLPKMTVDEKVTAALLAGVYKADLQQLRKRALRKIEKEMRRVKGSEVYLRRKLDDAGLSEFADRRFDELKEIRRQLRNMEIEPELQPYFGPAKKRNPFKDFRD